MHGVRELGLGHELLDELLLVLVKVFHLWLLEADILFGVLFSRLLALYSLLECCTSHIVIAKIDLLPVVNLFDELILLLLEVFIDLCRVRNSMQRKTHHKLPKISSNIANSYV